MSEGRELKGFVEWLHRPTFIIRAGFVAEEFLDDWADKVVCTVEEDGFILLQAYQANVLGEPKRELQEFFTRIANQETGKPVKLIRARKVGPVSFYQTSGVNGGKIVMKTLHEEVIAQSGGAKAAHPSQGGGLQVGESRVLPAQSAELSATIVEAYAAKIRAGEHKLSGITETYFGGGKFMRSFVIDETPN